MAKEPEVPEDEGDEDVTPHIAPDRMSKFTLPMKGVRLLDDDGNEISEEEFKKLHANKDEDDGEEADEE